MAFNQSWCWCRYLCCSKEKLFCVKQEPFSGCLVGGTHKCTCRFVMLATLKFVVKKPSLDNKTFTDQAHLTNISPIQTKVARSIASACIYHPLPSQYVKLLQINAQGFKWKTKCLSHCFQLIHQHDKPLGMLEYALLLKASKRSTFSLQFTSPSHSFLCSCYLGRYAKLPPTNYGEALCDNPNNSCMGDYFFQGQSVFQPCWERPMVITIPSKGISINLGSKKLTERWNFLFIFSHGYVLCLESIKQ